MTAQTSRSPDQKDFKNPDVDLRDVLAATTVKEESFGKFLAMLQ